MFVNIVKNLQKTLCMWEKGFKHSGNIYLSFVGPVVASATAELEVLGPIPGSDKVLLAFSIRNFSVAVTESGFVAG